MRKLFVVAELRMAAEKEVRRGVSECIQIHFELGMDLAENV